MSKEERKVPELRFKGFHDDWEQRKLGEISKLGSSIRIHQKDYVDYGIPFFRGSEISKLRSSSKLENILYISEEYYKELKEKNGVPQIDDILITAVGTLGNSYLVTSDTPFYFKDGNLIWISDIKISPQYLNTYLSDGMGRKRVLDSSAGSNQKALTMTKLKNVNISIPHLKEQKMIGKLFKELEKTIELHQRKVNILLAIKKAYLSKLFPRKDNNIPEIRFYGFKEVWEQCRLNSVYNVTMGHSPKSENYTSNPEDYILVQGNADIKNGWVKPRVWTTQITSLVGAGSILISVRAPVGNIGKTSYAVVIGRGIAAIEGDEFIYQLLSKMHMESYWRKFSTGSTFESINSKDIKEASIKLPDENERKKIGNFLAIVDSYITYHQIKANALVKLKKSYLNKMFL